MSGDKLETVFFQFEEAKRIINEIEPVSYDDCAKSIMENITWGKITTCDDGSPGIELFGPLSWDDQDVITSTIPLCDLFPGDEMAYCFESKEQAMAAVQVLQEAIDSIMAGYAA